MACEGLERIYAQTGRTAPLAAIYEAEAAAADTGPVRTFYALLAGEQRENLGDHEAALSAFRMALADPVGRERAIDAVRRLGVQLRRGGLMIEVISEQAETLPAAEQRARLLDLVDGLLSIGDEAGAVGILGDLCKAQPDFIGAWLIREHLHASADQWNDVVTCLEALEKRAASDVLRRRATASLQAVLAERGVTSETAYEYYRSLQEREPENVVALRGLAGIAHARGQFDDAKLYLEEVIRLSKDPAVRADASSLQGQILAEHDGDMAAAVKALEAALQAVPTHRPAIEGLKRVHSSAGNWSALVGVLARESSQAMPERRLAIFIEIAGLWENQIKNLKVATASWQKVLQEDPRNVEAMERLQGLFERMEDWGGFLDLGERVLHRLSGIELRDRQAELGVVAAERAGQVDRGMALLRAAAAADPPSLVAVQALRRLARSRGDWEQVVQLAEQEAELVEGGAEKAALLEEAAHIRLDQVLDREGAAPLFRRVLELDPDNAAALHFFVSWAFDAGEWAAALPVFERYERPVLAMDEDDEDARIEMTAFHYKFGVVLAKNGRPAAALDRFQKALALTPTHLPSLEAAAPCWFAQGDWEKARDIYRTTLRLRGGSGDAGTLNSLYLHLGQAEIKLADATNAQKRFKKILDQNPNHVEALIGLAQVHRLSEDWNSLLSTYNSIIKYARDPDQVIEAYMTKGDVLEQKLQFTDKAVLHYEKVLMYDRANVAAMARLGQIALKRGEGPRAKEMAERAAQSARNVEERALALLLGRLVDAGESVDVAAALYAVRQAGDVDGDVLIAFERATGGSVIDRDAAANAYRDAMRPL
jgi:tetratricopeptide (TPR) repeat protein